jgi:hypothetical protein
MAESIFTPHTELPGGPHVEPELRHTTNEPKGVLQKNLKTFVYLGAALLVIVAAIMSSTGKKTPAQQAAAKGQPPQPTLQDNTDNSRPNARRSSSKRRLPLQRVEIPRLRLQRQRSGPPHRPMGRPALRCLAFRARAFRVSPARKHSPAMANKTPDNRSLLRYRSRHSRLPRRNERGPTTRVSHPTLHTPVLVSSRYHKDQAR